MFTSGSRRPPNGRGPMIFLSPKSNFSLFFLGLLRSRLVLRIILTKSTPPLAQILSHILLVHVSVLQQEIGHVVSEPRCMYAQFVDVFDRLPAVSQQVAQMTMRGT